MIDRRYLGHPSSSAWRSGISSHRQAEQSGLGSQRKPPYNTDLFPRRLLSLECPVKAGNPASRKYGIFPLYQPAWPVSHCVENATVCCFLHSGALIRIGSFGLIRIIWPRSVKRHPHIEEQA